MSRSQFLRKVARMEIVATSYSDIGKWELLQFPGGGRIMFCGKRKEIGLVMIDSFKQVVGFMCCLLMPDKKF